MYNERRMNYYKQSEEELLVKEQLLIDFPKLLEDIKALTQCLDVLESQPVLVELLVDAMHVSRQILILSQFNSTCFLMRMLWAWTAIRDSSSFLLLSTSS